MSILIATALLELTVPIGSVYRDPANINVHTPEDIAQIAASLREFGQQTPIVVNAEGMILKGNGTHAAAESLGWPEIAISRFEDESDVAQLRYAIADNATGRLSRFADDALAKALGEVGPVPGFDAGMTDAFLKGLLQQAEESQPYEPLDPEVHPDPNRVESGDIWQLGPHFLLCGDSTDAASVKQMFHAVPVTEGGLNLIATDPPYGVDYGEKVQQIKDWDKALTKRGGGKHVVNTHRNMVDDSVENDTLSPEELTALIQAAMSHACAFAAPGAVFYVTGPCGWQMDCFLAAINASGFTRKWAHVWMKEQATIGRSDYQLQHEMIFYGWKEDAAHYWCGARDKKSVFEFAKPRSSKEHGTMKPVPLFAEFILNSSQRGQVVYDPFGGSGTTLLACEQTGRTCLTIEIRPRNCATILNRWEAMTGSQAIKVIPA